MFPLKHFCLPILIILRFEWRHLTQCFASLPERGKVIIKYLISSCWIRPSQPVAFTVRLKTECEFETRSAPFNSATQKGTECLNTRSSTKKTQFTDTLKTSPVLQLAALDIVDWHKCESILYNRNWKGFATHQSCAGKLDGSAGTCNVSFFNFL